MCQWSSSLCGTSECYYDVEQFDDREPRYSVNKVRRLFIPPWISTNMNDINTLICFVILYIITVVCDKVESIVS